ncbi:hypothetical protein [Nocardiopsis protaetiae]|uniref:hypothetical protein n=1 Tax=Nocardiopsis protaetiae TaxID=3382270 RepID=UPI00387B5286
MGVRLIVEALDHAPAALTPRERYVLVVLAETARDATRVCVPGIEDDPTFIRRSRLTSRTQRYAVLKALVDKGAIESVRRGQKHVRASYRLAAMAPPGADLPAPQGPENRDAEPDSQGPGFRDSGSRFPGLRVPKSGTPSPHTPQSPHQGDTHEPTDAHPNEPGAATKTTRKKKTTKQPLDIVMELGATETEAELVIRKLTAENEIGNLPGFLIHAAANGSLQGHLDTVRNSRRRRATVELCDEHTRPADRCPFCAAERNTA